jgi:deoxyribodipyrimidine photo-lyase
MHNRARMIVASWLCKNLRAHWRHGEQWFWERLVAADPANNPFGWQWVAGSGADAAPYWRVLQPARQGTKFDPEGLYVRRWVPELADLPAEYIHQPWLAPQSVLDRAGVVLGKTYPRPMADPTATRQASIAAFSQFRTARRS